MLRLNPILLAALLTLSTTALVTAQQQAVQFDVSGAFNTDVIVNYADGQIDTSQTPADTTSFGASNYAFTTQAAAVALNQSNPDGLPDDGYFPATIYHPEVQLGYNNASSGNNVRQLKRSGNFRLRVENGYYDEIHLFIVSGQGDSEFQVTFGYDDGSVLSDLITVPNWTSFPPETEDRYALIAGMDRIKADGSSLADINAISLFGFRFETDPNRSLVGMTIDVSSVPGGVVGGANYEGSFNFFGATGLATAVPEPSTALLLSLGGAAGIAGRRKRK